MQNLLYIPICPYACSASPRHHLVRRGLCYRLVCSDDGDLVCERICATFFKDSEAADAISRGRRRNNSNGGGRRRYYGTRRG